MKRACLLPAAAAAVILSLVPAPAPAQTSGTGLRGFVSDEQGHRLADVDVEIQFIGKPPRTYHQKTDKKGGFARIGLSDGNYKIFLTKESYEKKGIDMWVSLGGVSDICSNNPGKDQPCEDIVLKKARVAVAIGGAPAPAGAAGAGGAAGAAPGAGSGAATATAEEAAKLGATYQQAVEAIKQQQWDAAEAALKEVLAKVPDQPTILFNLGHVYRQKKDFASAEAQFKRATEIEPTKPDAFVALASLYEEQGKGGEAVDLLVKASPAFEQDANFQTALGATAMNAGREKDAETAFVRAATLDPSNVEVEYYLASLALNRNDSPEAIGHLEKYVAAAPATSPNVATAKALLAALQAKKK